MPRNKKRDQEEYANYRHKKADRKNLPTNEMADDMPQADVSPKAYTAPRRNGDEPWLAWDRGWKTEELCSHRPLFIQEKIHPGILTDSLRREVADKQGAILFKEFNGLTEQQQTEWYQHKARWQNRLIHGNSLEVCASLAAREGLAGAVQMIYFDPPYGIKYKSNFAIGAGTSDGEESPKQVGADPQSIKAFLDTWENGVHSYLDAIHKHATMAHSLLADSGSFFVQIGDENMMRVGLVLDEVFGAQNRVATITFVTSGSTASATLPAVSSYLLWYAKDKQKLSFNQLYEPLTTKAETVELMSSYVMLEEADGTTRNLTREEKENPDKNIATDARLFRRMPLFSQGTSTTGRSVPYIWGERKFACPPNSSWRVSHKGIDHLRDKGRLIAQGGDKTLLSWKRYEDEIPGRKINNVWHNPMSPSDKRYVVQTADAVVERCLLMSTEPGDLVLDFTCGSGTTPFVAEKWGRRWIAVDASQVAIATTRTRLATSMFDYYAISSSIAGQQAEAELRDNPKTKSIPKPKQENGSQDPADGFVYRRVPYVSAAVLAYDEEEKTPPIYLVNQPLKVGGITRICSPFTVESDRPFRHIAMAEAVSQAPGAHDDADAFYASHQKARAEILQKTGIRLKARAEILQKTGIRLTDGPHLQIDELKVCLAEPLSYIADYHCSSKPQAKRKCMAISFAPDDATVSLGFMRRAGQVAREQLGEKVDLVVVCGFAFDPDTCNMRVHITLPIARVQMNRQFQIEEVKMEKSDDNAFVMLGEPDIALTQEGKRYQVEVKGFATFDAASGNAKFGYPKNIYSWLLDTDYDGRSFFARRIHFPGEHNDKHIKKLKRELGRDLDNDAYAAMLSHKSMPFEKPNSGQIAVKIITRTGDEMIHVVSVG